MSKYQVIDKDGEQIIGYVQDITLYIKDMAKDFLKSDNWELVQEMAELLLDLNGWADNENLLVLDASNGMGYTIKEYKGE